MGGGVGSNERDKVIPTEWKTYGEESRVNGGLSKGVAWVAKGRERGEGEGTW
jgi:hypothetical protein